MRISRLIVALLAMAASALALIETRASLQKPVQPADPRASLAHEPLTAGALLELSHSSEVSMADRSRLLDLAGKVTRRNLAVQSELVAAAAKRGDLATSLDQIDRALTVYPQVGPAAFAALAASADDPEFMVLLAAYSRRLWFAQMLALWAVQAPDVIKVVSFIEQFALRPSDLNPGTIRSIINRLIAEGKAGRAAEFALRLGAPPINTVHGFGVDRATTDLSFAPFTWAIGSDQSGVAAVVDSNAVAVTVGTERRFVALRRTMALSAGRYQIALRQKISAQDSGLRTGWVIWCPGSTAVQARSISDQNTDVLRFEIDIPNGCPVQDWQLLYTAPNQQGDHRLLILGLSLTAI